MNQILDQLAKKEPESKEEETETPLTKDGKVDKRFKGD